MRIGVGQLVCAPGDVRANLRRWARLAERAADAGCRLLVLPELCDTGYLLDAIPILASPWPGCPLDTLRELAVRHNLAIAAGLSERADEAFYNSLALVGADGALAGHYRKLHLFRSERQVFTRGDRAVTAELCGWRIGLTICYDLRFGALHRELAAQGAELILNAAAWPAVRIEHWRVLLRARALDGQLWHIGANRTGTDAGLAMGGLSGVASPLGEWQALGCTRGGLLTAEVSKAAIADAKARLPLHQDAAEFTP